MMVLFHFPLCPFSRKVRLVLAEKGIGTEQRIVAPHETDAGFRTLNPAGTPPVLYVDTGRLAVCGGQVICEYLEEICPSPSLFGDTPAARAEARRLAFWFDEGFHAGTGRILIEEYHDKLAPGSPEVDPGRQRLAFAGLAWHLGYVERLVEQRHCLAGREPGIADFTAAAHLSCIDYLGQVPWKKYNYAREWYTRIKCRPSFRDLLQDRLPARAPASHYADPDF